MPNSTLPGDNELGDSEITTGEFQTKIDQLATWINALQAELNALSDTTVREGAVRSVNGGAGPLRANIGTSDTVQFGRVTDAATPGDGDFDSDKLGYWEATVELGGDFDAGDSVKVVRIGNVVTVNFNGFLTHSSASTVISDTGVIPSWARPSNPIGDVYSHDSQSRKRFFLNPSGSIGVSYAEAESLSIGYNDTSIGTVPVFSYVLF